MGLCNSCVPHDEDSKHIPELPEGTQIPVKKRKLTDTNCLVLLVLLSLFLVICVCVAIQQSDIRRLSHGHDDKGNLCGFKNEPIEGVRGSGLDYSEEKYLQITDYCTRKCWTERECVKTCKDGYDLSLIPRCATKDEKRQIEATEPLLKIISKDISLCLREILVLCFISICLSGFILILLRLFAKIVIWTILILVAVVCVGFFLLTWIMFAKNVALELSSDDVLYQKLIHKDAENWLLTAIASSAVTLCYFILLCKVRKKIKLVTALFEEGGKCLKNIPTMLVQPALTHLFLIIFTILAGYGVVIFETSGKAKIDENGNVSFPTSLFFEISSWILLFAYLWISQFLLACQNLVVSGAVCSWYFSRIKGKLVNPVWRSFCTIVKYHLGSAAFGSLIITVVKVIRMVFRMFEEREGIGIILWKIVQCILACIEAFTKILNKSAYVMIALFGQPFCVSACKAFHCITADASRIAVVMGVGTFILTIIELLIIISVTFIGAALIMNIEGIQFVWIPILIVFFLSILCCHCFFSVYDMTIDTLILCFCVDRKLNHGLENPYYMNSNLMVFLNDDKENSTEMAPIVNNDKLQMLA